MMMLLVLCTSCRLLNPKTASSQDQGMRGQPGAVSMSGAESNCRVFVTEKLIQSGGVRTNFLETTQRLSDAATGSEVLSESQGLWMQYCALADDAPRYKEALRFVRDNLDTGVLLSYRYDPQDGTRYPVNAAVDDLRILRALLLGGQQFGRKQDETLARQWARRLYETNVRDGRLHDFYDDDTGMGNSFLTLCYADLQALSQLARLDGDWQPVYNSALGTAKGGYISDAFPFFMTRYSYDTGAYEAETINSIESLLTALHLAQAGECPPQTVRFVREKVQAGALYGSYTKRGEALNQMQSTAVYALSAMLGAQVGDDPLYTKSVERMNALQVTQQDSPVFGAYADARTQQAYSFDNLTALLAHRAGEKP